MNGIEKLKIVVVTGSDFLNNTFKNFLTNQVCDVYLCADGLQCIKLAAEKTPSLIFIDMGLGGFNSVDTLKVLHALHLSQSIPVVIMIVHSQNLLLAEVIDLGISTILYKPFVRQDVLNVVDTLIGEKIRRQTEKLPVFDAVRINAGFQKTASALKMEKINKIKNLRLFLQSIPEKRQDILNFVACNDDVSLAKLYNELKNVGSSIGYVRLSLVSDFLSKKLANEPASIDWKEVDRYSQEILSLFDQIQIQIQ